VWTVSRSSPADVRSCEGSMGERRRLRGLVATGLALVVLQGSACRSPASAPPSPAPVRQALLAAGKLFEKRDYRGAADAYADVARRAPDSVEARLGLGKSLLALQSYDEARAAYDEAVRIRPNDPRPRFLIGQLETVRGRLPEALDAYRELAALTPNDPSVHGRLGRTLHALGRFPEAVAAFEMAQALDARYFTCGCRPSEHALYREAREHTGSAAR
jgi:tetratricopeptide (TPR) repeat protein